MATIWNNFFKFFSRAKSFVILTKPKLSALLLLTTVVEALSVYSGDAENTKALGVLTLSVLLSCMGTNTITCYLDREMDSIMSRTRSRPLPKGEVSPREALIFGVVLLLSGLILAATINIYVLFWGIIGAVFVISYNYRLKTQTSYNILIASPGGAAPILGAYSAMTGELIAFQPLILALLIIFWTPVHIWSLALFYKEDYKKAGVPMLPVVSDKEKVLRMILVFTALYIADSFAAFLMLEPIWLSLFMIGLLNYPLVKLLFNVRTNHYRLFRLSSLHLGAVFLMYLLLSVFMG
jgi:protoheme IX farnesyltransferase